MMANYNLGQNNMEQSTPSPKLRKKSSGPSQTIVWKTRGDQVSVEEARG